MERLIYSKLVDWKNDRNHKPLILLGARQVGKTYILQEFGRREFKKTVYLNCHEQDFAQSIFRNMDVDRIVRDLEQYFEVQIVEGETLMIFDEVQEVRNGVASLKYFCEKKPQLHVAVAGSLLGLYMSDGESFPVGKVQTMRMYPMGFVEYLMARGYYKFAKTVLSLDYESMLTHHNKLIEYLREYIFVGGMPEAVKEYAETHNTHHVRQIQSSIVETYMHDVGKHTLTMAQRIHMVWDSVPSQLARENKKFIFGAIRKGARSADYEMAIQWLINAGLIGKVKRVNKVGIPLKFYADLSAFKLYLMDCGLLGCLVNASPKDLITGDSGFTEFKGALAENLIYQQLQLALDTNEIFYFAKENSSQEIDFMVQTGNKLIPIEVKAGINTKSKSLSGFINIDHADKHLTGVRFSLQPYVNQGWMENIPLYAAEAFISAELKKNEQ